MRAPTAWPGTPDSDGRRPHQAHRRTWRSGTRSTAPCARVAYRRFAATDGSRQVVEHQARVPGHARGRDRAGRQRGASLPHGARLEARDRRPSKGALRRPHLTIGQRDDGSGRLCRAPDAGHDYRRGYLCGMIRGDGHLGSYSYERTGGARRRPSIPPCARRHRGSRRAERYPRALGVVTREFAVRAGHGQPARHTRNPHTARAERRARPRARRPGRGCRTRRGARVSWPASSTPRAHVGSCIRICNTDPEILGRVEDCLRRFGFDYAVEPKRAAPTDSRRSGSRGGLSERMRFFLGTDPAITRKRVDRGRALKTSPRLGVRRSVTSGSAMRMYDITTGTGDFIANGVVSHNCFARPTHKLSRLRRRA